MLLLGMPLALYTPTPLRPPLALALPLLTLAGVATQSSPGIRLLLTSLGMLYALKTTILLLRPISEVRAMSGWGLLLYFSLWPGMDPQPLTRRDHELEFPQDWFVRGWVTMIVGLVLLCAMPILGWNSSWLGLMAILTTVHLGYSDVLSALVRLAGFPVQRLFHAPLLSSNLREFWSLRWNRPFVEMNHILFVPLLRKLTSRRNALLGAFFVSGLLHEMAISFPVQAGYGGPLFYFVWQGLGVSLQGRRRSRLFTWLWLLLPLPLLFHAPFRQGLVQPLLDLVAALPPLANLMTCKSWLLWLAGWGHFLVLAASFQVPARLGWYEELPRLRPLNRKLLWVYGGFIVGLISSFGALILKLHPLMLCGETGSRHLLGLIAIFWLARLVVDSCVFEHSDWPSGPSMLIGHTCLTSLFVFIDLTCWIVLLT